MTKGRWIPDVIIEEDAGNGMKEIKTTEVFIPDPPGRIDPIQCFYQGKSRPVADAPKKKDWVILISMGASAIGGGAAVGVLFAPMIALPILAACIGWLGIVAFANK